MESRYIFPGDYMADPSAHVFEGKLFIYPSHDINGLTTENDNGDHFMMRDYHALRLDDVENGQAVDLGKILDLSDIPWAGKQLWDNDVMEKNGLEQGKIEEYDWVEELKKAPADNDED